MSRWTRAWGSILAGIAIAFLLVALLLVYQDHQEVSGRLERWESKRIQLQDAAARQQQQASQRPRNIHRIQEVLRHCRVPGDIPALGGERIVGTLVSSRQFHLVFYVPAGSHELDVHAFWGPNDESRPEETQVWTVPLDGPGGYLLRVDRRRETDPLGWELQGSPAAFTTVQNQLPLEGFIPRSWSWSDDRSFAFPNDLATEAVKGVSLSAHGVNLMQVALRGPQGEDTMRLRFVARLRSTGPRNVSVEAAWGYLYRGEMQDLDYRGRGRYELQPGAGAP